MLTVLKLGGSVVTKKDVPETVDTGSLDRASEQIRTFLEGDLDSAPDDGSNDPGQLVVVHGGGSFGHHHAAKHGVSSTEGSSDASALTEIHRAMGELNAAVVEALHERHVAALPVRPLSVAFRDETGLQFDTAAVSAMLDAGFVPVTHGDVIVDSEQGGTILSGDDIVVSLARSLGADRVGLCSTVPGVLDGDDEIIDRIDSYAEVEGVLGESNATDVTGGMGHKVRELLDLDAPASVFDVEALGRFLGSGQAGTVIR